MEGLISILFGVALFCAIYALAAPKKPINEAEYYEYFDREKDSDSLIRKAINNLYPIMPGTAPQKGDGKYEEIAELFKRSANPWNLRIQEWNAVKLLGAIVGSVAGIVVFEFMMPGMLPWWLGSLGLAALGYFLPQITYNDLANKRSKNIRRDLPNAIDLINVTMSIGRSFAAALKEVVPTLQESELKDELEKVSKELQMGIPLEQVMEDFAARSASEETANFANAIITSQRNGSDIVDTLDRQSRSVRLSYETMIEEAIAKLPSKAIVPIMGCMVPALLLLLGAPAMVDLQSI